MVVRKLRAKSVARRVPSEPEWTRAEVFIFDVEGTLVDAMMPTLRCWRETLEHFGHDVSLAELHRLAGMDGEEMLTQLLSGVSKTERKEMLEHQGKRFREEYLPHVHAFPGVLTGHFSARELTEAGCRAVFRDPVALREAITQDATPSGRTMEASAA